MITYNNSAPGDVNNVGLFGATEDTIGAYKQASEYAADAKYWALLAENKFGSIDELMAEIERLFQEGVLMREDIEKLKQDFIEQDARLMQLIAEANAAAANAQNAVDLVDAKLIEIQKQLDVLLGMTVTVETLPPGSNATGSFNNQTGEIHLGIPEGEAGKDGSVTDLATVDFGTPEIDDIGFYVDKDTSTVHKATLSDIANLIPSVRSVSLNGGAAETGNVNLIVDKTTVGLGAVRNVSSYSQTEIDAKIDDFIKTYNSKVGADADAPDRLIGETVVVWNDLTYDFYKVISGGTGQPNKLEDNPFKREKRIKTVNLKEPDSTGNIDITVPTGNPSLYLGEMVMFPYDPNKNISYPGVLPADGRLVPKASAGDLGPSLVSGQLPVVSETEWQAGATQYFSWGKLSDGITDADSTNYLEIRLPDWTTGESIRSPSKLSDSTYKGNKVVQKPYITTVNGRGPNDATGAVTLSASDFGLGIISTTGGGTPFSSFASPDLSKALRLGNDGGMRFVDNTTGSTIPIPLYAGGTGGENLEQAKANLGVNLLKQQPDGTFLQSPNGNKSLYVYDSGSWGCIESSTAQVIPLAIGQGGTGGYTASSARVGLELDRIEQATEQTQIRPKSGSSKRFFCHDNGDWGFYDDSTNSTLALGLTRGGTGGTSALSARTNLEVDRVVQSVGETDLQSQNSDIKLKVQDTGTWGTYRTSTQQWIPLAVEQGGTGATTVKAAQAKLQAMGSAFPDLSLDLPNLRPGVYYCGDATNAGGNGKPFNYAQVLTLSENDGTSGNWTQLAFSTLTNSAPKIRRRNSTPALLSNWSDFAVVGLNVTVDGNGFLKASSPIVNLKGSGEIETNEQAEGAKAERVSVGVYKISGVLGLNSDTIWGGIDGGFEIPLDRNKQPRIWLDYEVESDGTILVKTFHRTHPNSPVFARNEIEGFTDGDPIDIPSDTFISIRVEMPETK